MERRHIFDKKNYLSANKTSILTDNEECLILFLQFEQNQPFFFVPTFILDLPVFTQFHEYKFISP